MTMSNKRKTKKFDDKRILFDIVEFCSYASHFLRTKNLEILSCLKRDLFYKW